MDKMTWLKYPENKPELKNTNRWGNRIESDTLLVWPPSSGRCGGIFDLARLISFKDIYGNWGAPVWSTMTDPEGDGYDEAMVSHFAYVEKPE